MLSIIISSYQPDYFTALEKNIAETCGIPYEIIKIDNPGLMGICEAYNKGAAQAKYDNLLFLHEDVLFHTKSWGIILLNHLKDEQTGCIGIAGGDYVPIAPSSWFTSVQHNFAYLIQNGKGDNPEMINTASYKTRVLVLDGVFLAVRKEVFLQNTFSDDYLHSYHGYDTDFSLKIAKHFKNYVINDILIEHFSGGSFDDIWIREAIKVRDRLGSDFQKKRSNDIEFYCYIKFLHKYHSKMKLTINSFFSTIRFLPIRHLTIQQLKGVKNCYLDIYKKS